MRTLYTTILTTGCALGASTAADEGHVLSVFERSLPHLSVASIEQSPITNLYEVRVEEQNATFFVAADASYLIAGDLYEFDRQQGVRNLTEHRREISRANHYFGDGRAYLGLPVTDGDRGPTRPTPLSNGST